MRINSFVIAVLTLIPTLLFGQEKPNVLFISVDDLKPLVGAYGNPQILSPNIDKLANQGTLFLNTSCQQAVCGPSRASVLTGLYPDNTEVYNLSTLIRDKNPDVITLPQYFKNNGYATTGAGKTFDPRSVDDEYDGISWSIAYKHTMALEYYNQQSGRGYKGFHNPQVPIDDAEYEQYLIDQNITNNKAKNEAKKLFPFAKPATESMDLPDDSYTDGARAKYALEKLDELSGGADPFFLAVGFAKPHLPFVAPTKYWNLYDRNQIEINPEQGRAADVPAMAFHNSAELINNYSDIPWDGVLSEDKQKELIHGYMASVSYIDAQVGKLLSKLDELGIADNTIIVLWGDHGWHLGDHNMWAKHSVFEQAVKSPLIIYSPKQGQPANVNNSPVELIDIYPTLCNLAGLEVPAVLEGKTLVPLMEQTEDKVREAALSQYPRTQNGQPHMGYSLRNDRYRYTKWIQMDYLGGERFGPTAGVELYDYETDPYETTNLANDTNYEPVINDFELLFKERNIAQNTASSYIKANVCDGETYVAPDGQTYTSAGIYTSYLKNDQQEDSVITINLTVTNVPSNEVTLVEGTLIAAEENAMYSWLNCDTQELIENEASNKYTPTETGSYSVQITDDNCGIISDCLFVEVIPDQVLAVGKIEKAESNIEIYPNPIDHKLIINFSKPYSNIRVSVLDLYGQLVFAETYDLLDQVELDFNYPKGVYIIKVDVQGKQLISKMYKQ